MFDRDHAPRVLSAEQEELIDEQAMRILEEIGTDVLHEDARARLAAAGLQVDGERVRWDRGFVREQVAKAPATFTLHARNSERSVEIGGGTPLWKKVSGPPLASGREPGRRRR